MRINHNIAAQMANANLKRADARVAASLERLSSGYKINKAADDASGLAISNKMRGQIRSLDQASRNASDGSNIIQTAEGALSEIEAIIQRMRELSVQAANDVYTIDDRDSIQQEIDKLLDEVDRIASTTEFNGNGLLDGSCTRVVTFNENGFDSLAVSEGVQKGEYVIQVKEQAAPAQATLNYTIPTTGTSTVRINGVDIEISSTDTDDDVISRITEVCDKLDIDIAGGGAGSLNLTTRANGSSQFIAINDDPVITGKDVVVKLVSGFPLDPNDPTGSTLAASVVVTTDGNSVTIEDSTGFKMQIAIEEYAATDKDVTIAVYDTGSMKMQIGANEHQDISIDFPEVSCRTLKFKESDGDSLINVCSQQGASRAITTFDDAIRSVSASRSVLGAYQNRLESTVASLDVTSENMTNSMSRIMDTDMAASMTDYTQESVLSQAATAMLAQANNRPQQILSLLQS